MVLFVTSSPYVNDADRAILSNDNAFIDRIREVLPQGETPTIVATGSNAPVIVRYCRNKIVYDKYLLMDGLWAIYQKNK